MCPHISDLKGGRPGGRTVSVIAGAAPLRPPSLQYCTALGLAALGGHAEVIAALLACGQVRRGGPGGLVAGMTACH